ncbi:malto-oligosyltrehalose trehalohydrolase [Enterovirga sp. CN4-39]|uniref:malto-oligosyltrehalose trehalohydrolase n=1 Tax=Enterovirga sp. CN4-39 TaxID=3400910 RepID=UPI003C0D0633
MRRRHAMPFGAEVTDRGVRFALWAPSAEKVALVVDGAEHEMPHVGEGWRRLLLPKAKSGSRYGFRIDGGETIVPDPASRFQPDDVSGLSEVVDPRDYEWRDRGWAGRPWEEAVVYEAHVGTATPEGTYAALAGKLEGLRDLGITAIELLPLADFAGARNWGYDGVLPFAPDGVYGRPEDLKQFIDRAHALGIMVLIDVVYNHFGPAGNYLHQYAEQFFTERHQTPWGAGLNFDGADGKPVRDFFVHNALYWIEEFNVDGLRFDAVHAILDDSDRNILAELAERVRAAAPGRHIHLVLENEKNQARWLERDEAGTPRLHTAQWNDDVHHCWHVLLTGESEAYFQDFSDKPVERLVRCLVEGFGYQGDPSAHAGGKPRGEPSGHLPPSAFVAFLQNHDQIGNRAFGERLSALADPDRLALARAGLLLSPQIPMLFMGEEWSASAPYQFFVDFAPDEDLSGAVREGRRREFQHFAAFSDPGASEAIPDPTAEETFTRSTLDWEEASREPHASVLADTRRLLALRREHVIPLTRTRFRGAEGSMPNPRAIEVTWRFDGGTLRFVANFGTEAMELRGGYPGRVIWASPGLDATGLGPLLPAWAGFFMTGDAG